MNRAGATRPQHATTLHARDAYNRSHVVGWKADGWFQLGYERTVFARTRSASLTPSIWDQFLAEGEVLELVQHDGLPLAQQRAYRITNQAARLVATPVKLNGGQIRWRIPVSSFTVFDHEENQI